MTTHYTIHSPTTGRTLKVSYKGGKFFRLEKVAGIAIPRVEMQRLGMVIPPTEDQIPEFISVYQKLEYTKVEKAVSTYQQYVGAWHGFFERTNGYAPKFTGVDGKALNQIKAHLTKISGSETDGLALFSLILDNWHKLDDFHKENTDLKYINSRLNVILNAVKKANNATTGGLDNSVSL